MGRSNMPFHCKEHPGKTAVFDYNRNHYCQQCQDGYSAALAKVDVHVNPKDCFLSTTGTTIGIPLAKTTGPGAAHWVSHQKNIQTGYGCLKGFTVPGRSLGAIPRARGTEIAKLEEVQADISDCREQKAPRESFGKSCRKRTPESEHAETHYHPARLQRPT